MLDDYYEELVLELDQAREDYAATRAALLKARDALRQIATTGVRTSAEAKEIAGRGYAATFGEEDE